MRNRAMGSHTTKTTIPWQPRLSRWLCGLAGIGLLLVHCEHLVAAGDEPLPQFVRYVDIVHMTHTDVGYTDHPVVCREQQVRYLDIAIDAVLATRDKPPVEQFCWTAETTLAVDDWWRSAAPARRQELLQAVRSGQLEIAALPMNQTPTLDATQWQTMLHWIPEELWQKVQPRVAVQDDVNGFPRAGAVALLDRGVNSLLMGINPTLGAAPLPTPTAFWWKMPDGRRLFVWLGDHYTRGYYYFYADSWRRGPVPESTDTRYRPARPGELFQADDDAVRAAHAHLLGELKKLEAAGYKYPRVVAPVTNEWRMDNDPPFPAMAEFVATWQRLGLQPQLRMTTVGDALQKMQEEIGDQVPELTGEWPDWWANGGASGPREMAASRRAKRLAAAAMSPVWGPLQEQSTRTANTILRDLCLFDEHTWGASDSVGQPHSLETWAQYNEKSRYAYRPMALAKLLLAQRSRTAIYPREEGLYVVNTAEQPWSGWVVMPSSCLRGDFHSLRHSETQAAIPLVFEAGYRPHSSGAATEFSPTNTSETFPDLSPNQQVRFWVDALPGRSIQRYLLSEEVVEGVPPVAGPTVQQDDNGWPVAATWPGMEQPLFTAGTGDFQSVSVNGFAGRWSFLDMFSVADPAQREKLRAEKLRVEDAAVQGPVSVRSNPHTTVYSQTLQHSRLRWITRELELWHATPRARLTVRLDRLSGELPEIFFLGFTLPCPGVLPSASNGGLPFVPYQDQLPGTCRDYFSIDGWLNYETPAGQWLWATRDAPLVTFQDHQVLARAHEAPPQTNRVLAMLFNNIWFTNFVADSHGALEFQFDLAWTPSGNEVGNHAIIAETLQSEPTVVINVEEREHPIFMQRLHR
ncbi:MAG: glycoside hydrolase family 38 N-terminal domain-containing protein [Pirellulaceae bacterium]